MRRGRGKHLIRETKPGQHFDGSAGTVYVGWCGEKHMSEYGTTSIPWAHDLCSRCSAAFYGAKIKAQPHGFSAERIALPETYEADKEHRPYGFGRFGWKSAYLVRRDADQEPVAVIAIETGWGERWKTFALEAPVTVGMMRDGTEPKLTKAEKVVAYYSREYDRDGVATAIRDGGKILTAGSVGYSSRERALWEVQYMMADGVLKPGSRLIAEAYEELAAERATLADRERRRDEAAKANRARAERIANGLTALEEIRDTFGAALTNFQAAGLADVIAHLKGEL